MKNIYAIYKKSVKMLENIGIKTGCVREVKINAHMHDRWGTCRRVLTDTGECFEIELSENLLDDELSDVPAETTMLHELLHTCGDCMNHGYKWKKLAEKVNKYYGCDIKRKGSYESFGIKDPRESQWKYMVVCSECGAVIHRIKKSNVIKYPYLYMCAKCGGTLKNTECA